jgi:glycosyltransferase involved in cell wall biosynthesis
MSAQERPEISVVVPVLNDEPAISLFISEIDQILGELDIDFEVIFCVDPSSDGTDARLAELVSQNQTIKAIFFANRVGQGAATLAGMMHSRGRAIVIMDVDLQDPPSLIPEMIRLWRQGHLHVLPRRTTRSGEPISKVLTAKLGYWFLGKFSNTNIPANTGDFRLFDASFLESFQTISESHVFLRGFFSQIDSNPFIIEFNRPARSAGKTKYNKWFGSFKSAMDGLLSYSTALLGLSTWLGFILATTSFLFGTAFVLLKILGTNFPVGWVTLILAVIFIGGIQLFSLGVLGMYIGRIFQEIKRRPRWNILKAYGITDLDRFDETRSNRSRILKDIIE